MRKEAFLPLIAVFLISLMPSALNAASVHLSWRANSEADLQSYNVYYGTQSRSYGLPIPLRDGTTCTIENLDAGRRYYFAVTAIDNTGNESGYSTEVSKVVTDAGDPVDTTAPVVTITSPTSSSNYTTEARRLTIAGTAEGANTIQQVIVSVPSLGLTRLASGTNDWSITGTLPHEGIYEITISAEDVYGNIGQDNLNC